MARISSLVYHSNLSGNSVKNSALLCFPRHLFRLVVRQCVDVPKCISQHLSDYHLVSYGRIISNLLLYIILLNVLFVDFGDAHGIHLTSECQG